MTIEKAVRAWPGWKLVRLGGHLYEHHRLIGASWARHMRIPVESGHHSGGKKTTVPMGKRPAFRFDCGHHSDEKGQCIMRE